MLMENLKGNNDYCRQKGRVLGEAVQDIILAGLRSKKTPLTKYNGAI